MENLDFLTEKVRVAVKASGGFDRSVKLDLGKAGIIFIKDTQVNNDDHNAECTLHLSPEDFIKIGKGELDPVMAFMAGKVKISGDVNVAMGLQNLMKDMVQA